MCVSAIGLHNRVQLLGQDAPRPPELMPVYAEFPQPNGQVQNVQPGNAWPPNPQPANLGASRQTKVAFFAGAAMALASGVPVAIHMTNRPTPSTRPDTPACLDHKNNARFISDTAETFCGVGALGYKGQNVFDLLETHQDQQHNLTDAQEAQVLKDAYCDFGGRKMQVSPQDVLRGHMVDACDVLQEQFLRFSGDVAQECVNKTLPTREDAKHALC